MHSIILFQLHVTLRHRPTVILVLLRQLIPTSFVTNFDTSVFLRSRTNKPDPSEDQSAERQRQSFVELAAK